MIILHKTAERMRELIKTMPRPVFHLVENNTGIFTVLKNINGVVEYRYAGEDYPFSTQDVEKKKYSDCLSLLIDLKNIKEAE